MTDDSEAATVFGRSKCIISIVITLNQELNSLCQRKLHSQYHCDILTGVRRTNITLDGLQQSRIENNWHVDGDRNLSELCRWVYMFCEEADKNSSNNKA